MTDITNSSVNKPSNMNVRLFFSKKDRAKYISHLDLYRTIQRAIKRAGIPVWETEGFNPHIYLTFALPLSLGIEGSYESMDIKLTNEMDFPEIKNRLNNALPDGLRIITAAEPMMKHTAIKKAKYEIFTEFDTSDFSEFINQDKILTEKKTKKKGVTVIDLKPFVEIMSVRENNITLCLPAGTEFTINTLLVMEAFGAFCGKKSEYLHITRTEIYTGDGVLFF